MEREMSCIILIDMRENNGSIVALEDENGNIAQYENYGQADDVASEHPLTDAFPVRIVDMDGDED